MENLSNCSDKSLDVKDIKCELSEDTDLLHQSAALKAGEIKQEPECDVDTLLLKIEECDENSDEDYTFLDYQPNQMDKEMQGRADAPALTCNT